MNRNAIAYQYSEKAQVANREIDETGRAIGGAAHERGERLSDVELSALAHYWRWGSDGYPIVKRGRGWAIEHAATKGAGIFDRKWQAVRQWEILAAKWRTMKRLEADERADRETATCGEVSHA